MLCCGRLLRVSDVETSLVSMLQGLLSTSETSESVAGRLHSVSTAASAGGIFLDVAPDDKVFLHVEFGRCSTQSFALGGHGPHSFKQPTGAHHQQCSAGSSIQNTTAPPPAQMPPSFLACKISEEKDRPTADKILSNLTQNRDFFGVALHKIQSQ